MRCETAVRSTDSFLAFVGSLLTSLSFARLCTSRGGLQVSPRVASIAAGRKLGCGFASWAAGSQAEPRARKLSRGLASWAAGSQAGPRARKLAAGSQAGPQARKQRRERNILVH
jgi:hypothetical protein